MQVSMQESEFQIKRAPACIPQTMWPLG